MTIHILVEGPSERVLMEGWASRLMKGDQLRVHPHQGKGRLPKNPHTRPSPKHRGLLDQLPAKLRAFSQSLHTEEDAVLILVDADDDEPVSLRDQIASITAALAKDLRVVVHLAIEEVEAFYLGDLKALRKAFPGADMALAQTYVPDSICGTWEFFGKVVRDEGGNKVAWAEAMGPVLTLRPATSRSPSFKEVVNGLVSLRSIPKPKSKRDKAYRHPQRKNRDPSRRR